MIEEINQVSNEKVAETKSTLKPKAKVKNEEDALLKKINQERIRDSIDQWSSDNPDAKREHFEDPLLERLMLNLMDNEQSKNNRKEKTSIGEMLMITSAIALTDEEKEKIVRKFLTITKKPLRRITTVVDPALITGVRLQSESFYYEVSGQKTLKELRRHLDRNWQY